MKTTIKLLTVLASLLFTGCERLDMSDMEDSQSQETKSITFTVNGGFKQQLTRATAAGESQMTDLWVLDYVDGALVQQVHQASTEANFGSPTLSLKMGQHELYFVASMGGTPVVSTEGHSITWSTPRDTFWKKLSKNVTANTGATATVTLERVATRLRVNIEDALPETLAKVEMKPTTWYYGLDYLTGEGTDARSEAFSISIPSSYAGRTNTQVGIMGLSLSDEWTTDVTVTARQTDGTAISTETITAAPMLRNRSTDYTGTLFLSENVLGVTLNDDWADAWTGRW